MIPTYKINKTNINDAWIHFKEKNESKLHKAMVESIIIGINKNLLSVISITFILENDKKYSIRCIRDKWHTLLNDALLFFIKTENYEMCARIRDAINAFILQKINTTL